MDSAAASNSARSTIMPLGDSALLVRFGSTLDDAANRAALSLARRLADYYHLPHLDTGLTYRAVAHMLIAKGWPLGDAPHAVEAARLVDLTRLDRQVLSAHAVGEAASKVAVIPEVRRILVEKQRAFAARPEGAVLDGRDIGTVVCPDAPVKLYVTASAAVITRGALAELAASALIVSRTGSKSL